MRLTPTSINAFTGLRLGQSPNMENARPVYAFYDKKLRVFPDYKTARQVLPTAYITVNLNE